MFRSTKDPLTFSNISSSQCCSDPVPHRGVGVSHRTDPVFLYQVLLSPTSPEICSAGRFTQCSVCTLMKWKLSDIPGAPLLGGITVLISRMVFTPHTVWSFCHWSPNTGFGLDMTGLSPRPSLQLSKDDVSIIRALSMDPVDMYWHWLQIMLIRSQW